jgi:hypothetical protein
MTPILIQRLLVALSAAMLWNNAPALWDRPRALTTNEPLLLVAGNAFPADDISLSTLKLAFRGQIAQVAGKRVIPINHAVGTELRMEFDRIVLGLEPSAVGRYWVDRRIRDEGMPPKSIPTAELAVRVVAAVPSAITYARRAMLNPKVKALSIDGKAAGEPGYALSAAR